LIRTFFLCIAKQNEGSHLSRKPSGSSLTSGSAKNPRVGEYPSLFIDKLVFLWYNYKKSFIFAERKYPMQKCFCCLFYF